MYLKPASLKARKTGTKWRSMVSSFQSSGVVSQAAFIIVPSSWRSTQSGVSGPGAYSLTSEFIQMAGESPREAMVSAMPLAPLGKASVGAIQASARVCSGVMP